MSEQTVSVVRHESGLPGELVDWIERITSARLTGAQRRPGGGRRQAWFVDVQPADGPQLGLFLRYDTSDPAITGDPFTLDREARFYGALQGSDVPVPTLFGSYDKEQAILCGRVEGETWFSRLKDEAQRLAVAGDFMAKLAALHRIDPARLDIADEVRGPIRACVEAEIAKWEGLYRFGDSPEDPLIEFGLVWLKANIPTAEVTPVIVQGDTGPGNFLYLDGRVTAVLDWELAHLGDPMEDLGWLALRAVQEPFTNLADRFADYARLSGTELDLDRIRYYRLFAELKVVILGHRKAEDENLLGEVGNGLIYGTLHRKLFAEALLAIFPAAPPTRPVELTGEPTEREWIYDAMLAQLSQIIVPNSPDPFVVLRAKGMARMTKYLRQADRYAPSADQYELAILQDALGHRPTAVSAGRAELVVAIRAGTVTDTQMLAYIDGRAQVEVVLMRPAMGVLADRNFDPLTH